MSNRECREPEFREFRFFLSAGIAAVLFAWFAWGEGWAWLARATRSAFL
jgi:hypothetical protein